MSQLRGGASARLTAQLRHRLAIDHLFCDHALFPHLTPTLRLPLHQLYSLDILRQIPQEQALSILLGTGLLKEVAVEEGREGQWLQVEYPDAHQTVLVLGVPADHLEKECVKFGGSHCSLRGELGLNCPLLGSRTHNGFFSTVPTAHPEVAKQLMIHLRKKKKHCETGAGGKVRILVQSEGLFSLFLDCRLELKQQMAAQTAGLRYCPIASRVQHCLQPLSNVSFTAAHFFPKSTVAVSKPQRSECAVQTELEETEKGESEGTIPETEREAVSSDWQS